MRDAPRPLPSKLPNVTDIAKMIQRAIERPDIRLGDYSIGQLLEELGDGTPAWLTGSNVWMPAMFGEALDPPGDYDVVFATQEAATRFAERAVSVLNHRIPATAGEYRITDNKFGSGRITHPDGKHVIDAWSLGDSETIGEVLMSYPRPYQRAAYYVSRNPSPGCVFRIAPGSGDEIVPVPSKPGIFARISAKKSRSSYPGA